MIWVTQVTPTPSLAHPLVELWVFSLTQKPTFITFDHLITKCLTIWTLIRAMASFTDNPFSSPISLQLIHWPIFWRIWLCRTIQTHCFNRSQHTGRYFGCSLADNRYLVLSCMPRTAAQVKKFQSYFAFQTGNCEFDVCACVQVMIFTRRYRSRDPEADLGTYLLEKVMTVIDK